MQADCEFSFEEVPPEVLDIGVRAARLIGDGLYGVDLKETDRGVLVVMNDRIHGAHSLTKTNTTSVEIFISPINGLIGTVNYGKADYFRRPFRKHTHKSQFSVKGVTSLPRVDIIYACADMPARR
mgnify:CR=1 FL=1